MNHSSGQFRSGDLIVTINDWMTTKMDRPEVIDNGHKYLMERQVNNDFQVAIHLFEAASNRVVLDILKSSMSSEQCVTVGLF